MKKMYSKVLILAVLVACFCACKDNENDPKEKVDYDKMIGTWTLNSYTETWMNTDENIVEKDRSVNEGTLTIRKEKDDAGDMQYYYTENFVSDSCTEYSGQIDISGGFIYLHGPDGFSRGDGAEMYDYKVSFPADNKMEWSYNWTGAHSDGVVSHQDRRTVKGIFTKQK